MPDIHTASPRSPWKQVLALAALYAAVNIFAFRMVWMLSKGSEWEEWRQVAWRNFVVGFIASQVAALSMALVFGPGHHGKRLFCWWSVGGVLWACWFAGYGMIYLSFEHGFELRAPRSAAWDVTFSLPLAAIIGQAPLWMLRLGFGWRWERDGDAHSPPEVCWSLADMLIGTALVAASLALIRLVDYPHDFGFWIGWGYFALFIVLLSLLGVGAAMVATLRGWNWWAGAPVVLVFAFIGGALVLAIHCVWDSSSLFWSQPDFVITVTIPPFVAFAAGLLFATYVARALGFRLVMGRSNLPRAGRRY